MATAKKLGPLNAYGSWLPPRTPGTLGVLDHGDPNVRTLPGDSPGSLGILDHADVTFLQALFNGLHVPAMAHSKGRLPVPGGPLPLNAKADSNITADQLKQIFTNADSDLLKKVAEDLNKDLAKYGLDTRLRRAHFFAQVREESGAGLMAREEDLTYNEAGLKLNFKYYRDHPNEAKEDGYVKDANSRKIIRKANKEKIANKAYALRNGNGDAASGDGWAYRGRGYIQVTGRANYRATATKYQKVYGDRAVDFEKTPDLMAQFPHILRSAVCFWLLHGLHKKADAGDKDANVDAITKVINLHTHSYAQRRTHFKTAYRAFK